MPIVNIPGVGSVNFPDTMSSADITKAIETDILKTTQAQQPVELPKQTPSETFESNLLSPLMAMSRGFGSISKGGVSQEALSNAVQTAETGAEENPISGFAGKLAGLIGPSVPVLASLPVLAPAAGLGGMGAGIVGGAAAAPTVGTGTGVERYQSLINKGIPEDEATRAGWTEGLINAASNMVPTRGGLISRAMQGGAINTGTGIGNRAIQNEIISDPKGHQDPFNTKAMAMDFALGSVTEGAFGGRKHERLLARDEPAGIIQSAQTRLETGSGNSIGDVELNLLQNNHHILTQRRADMQEELQVYAKLLEDGIVSPEIEAQVKGLEGEIRAIDGTLEKLNKIFNDPKQMSERQRTEHKALMDQRKNQLIEELKGRKKAAQERQAADADEAEKRFQRMQEENAQIEADMGLQDVNPKTPPPVIAAENIGRAMSEPNMAPILLQRALKVQSELEARAANGEKPGAEYSSLKESLEVEIKAYQDIIAGKQPDLSWFESKVKPVKEPTSSFEGEVFPSIDQSLLDNAPRTDVEAPRIDEPTATDTQVPVKQNQSVTEADLNKLSEDIAAYDRQQQLAQEGVPAGPERFDQEIPDADPNTVPPVYDKNPLDTPVKEELSNPFEDYFNSQRELASVEKALTRISNQLDQYEQGLIPSGTIDVGQLTTLRQKLEGKRDALARRSEKLLVTNPKLREWLHKRQNKAAIKAEEKMAIEPKQYGSLAEILAAKPANLIDTLLNNKQFFRTSDGTKLFFDKNVSPELQRMFEHYVKKLGLQDEQLFIVFEDLQKTSKDVGNMELFGNTGLIRIDSNTVKAHVSSSVDKPTSLYARVKDLPRKLLEDFTNIRVASHELGHFLFVKHLNTFTYGKMSGKKFIESPIAKKFIDQFADWQVSNNAKMFKPVQQKYFDEFFADAVARELMFSHTLGAFRKDSKFLQAFQSMITMTKKMLQEKHPNVDVNNFVSELVNNIIKTNQDLIKTTGKTVWETHTQKMREDAIFGGMTLEDTTMDLRNIVPEWFEHSNHSSMSNPDIVPASTWSVTAATNVVKKIFGKTQVAQIFKDNPHVQKAYWNIREAEKLASKSANKIWHGLESFKSWDGKSVFTKFNKTKDGSSAYHQTQKTTDLEANRIQQVLQRGFDEGLEYDKTLELYGQHLTPNERLTYDTWTKMWTEQYQNTVKLQEGLDKKHTLPYRPGWFPAVRQGDWYVNIGFDGHTSYRQHFATKTAADAFIQKMKTSQFKHLDVAPPQKKGVGENPAEQKDFLADAIEKLIQDKYPTAKFGLIEDIENLKQLMNRRGGKLGMHHEQRAGILGFKGSEINLSEKEMGRSFKEAIIKSVDDYSNGLRSMYVRTKVGEQLNDITIDPDSKSIIQQMYDSTLSMNDTKIVNEFDSAVRETVERSVKFLVDRIPGVEYKGKTPAYDTMVNKTLEMLYLYKVMAKSSFILGQFMTPIQAIRHMSYDGGFVMPYVNMGKGLWNLTTGNKELKQALYQTRNESHTFEPAFIDALHLTDKDGPILEFIKDYVMLRKPAEFADTMSRVMTFSAMFEHYKSLGHRFDEAVRLAQQGTDATMVQYNKQESAPVFQHMGMTGNQIRPLQTFPTAALGNLVADIKHMSLKDYKSFAPFLNYALTTIALGGVLSLMFIQEYEMIRKWMEDKNPGSGPPAVTDLLIQDPTLLDRVEVDTTAVQQAALLGIPAATTGVDLSSSLRANEALATVVVGVLTGHKNFTELLPLANLTTDIVGGLATLASGKFKDISVADKAKAIDKAGPSGHFGYGLKEIAGVNETKVFGDNTGMMIGGKAGDATQQRTTTDKVAGYLGTKATDTRTNLLLNMRMTELNKRRQEKIKQYSNLFVETGKSEYIEKLADLDVTDEQIANSVSNTVYKKVIDQRLRDVATRQGRINPTRAKQAVDYGTLE